MRSALIVGVACVAVAGVASCGTQNSAVPQPTPSDTSSGSSASPSATAGDLGASGHTNTFLFQPGKGVRTIAYSWDGNYTITSGQESTWGGVTAAWDGSLPTPGTTDTSITPPHEVVTVQAGRKGDTSVYDWFIQRAPNYWCADPSFSIASTQHDTCILADAYQEVANHRLNFAFTGSVRFNDNSYPVVMAQGDPDSSGANTWFYGGPGWTVDTAKASITTPDGAFTILSANPTPEHYAAAVNAN